MQTCTSAQTLYVVLSRGERVMESLLSVARAHGINSGTFSGIGAVHFAEIAYYTLPKKEYRTKHYEKDREVVSLMGNVAQCDSAPFIHAHIVLSDENMNVVGGHLVDAVVAVTLEVTIHQTDMVLTRVFDADIGLKRLQVPA